MGWTQCRYWRPKEKCTCLIKVHLIARDSLNTALLLVSYRSYFIMLLQHFRLRCLSDIQNPDVRVFSPFSKQHRSSIQHVSQVSSTIVPTLIRTSVDSQPYTIKKSQDQRHDGPCASQLPSRTSHSHKWEYPSISHISPPFNTPPALGDNLPVEVQKQHQ
jgi:hypothetical protein